GWTGLFVPAGTPPAVVERLDAAARAMLADTAVAQRVEAAGASPAPLRPEEFEAFIRAEIARWTTVVRAANITLE
ncbi:tripartite tricarboxylate transporter substrate-binding protein, partial [Falsiroseomonas sp. CW058]|uniref:tripartite tricarboxylate transporter substrate-binding protein n=1 Tax=Falsiroseomonas sp. CW058 TaxID=3388664 RepID=UPI003D31B09C